MNNRRALWVIIGFIGCFLVVGVPYWLMPYNKVNLPSALIGPGLLAVALAAMMLRLGGVTSLWTAGGAMGASVPAAVLTRVFVEVAQNPTRHNLWPFEIIIALVVGFGCATGGAIAGALLAKLRAGNTEDKSS